MKIINPPIEAVLILWIFLLLSGISNKLILLIILFIYIGFQMGLLSGLFGKISEYVKMKPLVLDVTGNN